MSTYIVEVDSVFRDVNKYPTQTDFSVSFQQSSSSEGLVLGESLNFMNFENNSYTGTYYDNFFLPTSIDPDFANNNLNFVGCLLQDIQRSGNSFFYSGIAFSKIVGYTGVNTTLTSSTGFNIIQLGQTIFSLTSVNNMAPFLCRLDRLLDNTFEFKWCIYANSIPFNYNPSNIVPAPSSTKAITRISPGGNLFWMFDFNFIEFNVTLSESNLETTLYSITNPIENNSNTMSAAVFGFNQDGTKYISNNRNWGYHVFNSDFKVSALSKNSMFGMEVDASNNIYANLSLNPFDLSAKTVRMSNSLATSFQDTSIHYSQLTSRQYMTGSSGSETGGTGTLTEFYYYQTNKSITIGQSDPLTIDSFVKRAELPLSPFIGNNSVTPFNGLEEINNGIYSISFVKDAASSTGISSGVYPAYVFQVDPIGTSVTLAASTSSLFNNVSCAGVTIGNAYYFAGQTTSGVLYLYSYDASANLLNSLASGAMSGIQSINYKTLNVIDIDSDTLLITSPNLKVGASNNYLTKRYSLYVWTYVISSSTLTLRSSDLSVYDNSDTYLIHKNSSILYIYASLSINNISFIDLSSPSDPILLKETTTIYYQAGRGISFYQNKGHTELLSFGYFSTSLFNIDDVESIYAITNDIVYSQLADDQFSGFETKSLGISGRTLTSSNYIYAKPYISGSQTIDPTIYSSKCRWITFPCQFTSSHFTQNLRNQLSLSASSRYTLVNTVAISSTETYVVVASQNNLVTYRPDKTLINLDVLSVFSFSPLLDTAPVDLNVYYYQNTVYIAVSTATVSYIYTTSNKFTSYSLFGSVTRSGSSPIACTNLIYTEFSPIPKFYFTMFQKNNLARKYEIIPETSSILLRASNSFALGPGVLATSVAGEFGNYEGKYILYLVGTNSSTLQSAGLRVDITTPNQIVTAGLIDTFPRSNLVDTSSVYLLNKYYLRSTRLLYNTISSNGFTRCGQAEPVLKACLGPTVNSPDLTYNRYVTSWIDDSTNKPYIAQNVSGQTGTSDSLLLMDVSNPNAYGYNTVPLPGYTSGMSNYKVGSRVFLAVLCNPLSTGPSQLWTYDVSNVLFSSEAYNTVSESVTYTNIHAEGGASVLASLSRAGTSRWLSYVGCNIETGPSSVIPTNIVGNSIVIDKTSNLYMAGGWSNLARFYQSYSETGYVTSMPDNFVNQMIDSINSPTEFITNSFISRLDLITGKWLWNVPISGNGSTYVQKIRYSGSPSVVFAMSYKSENAYVFESVPSFNPTGSALSSLQRPQLLLNNSSAGSSSVIALNTDGTFNWNFDLFSYQSFSEIILSSIFIDEFSSVSKIVCAGITNSTELLGQTTNKQMSQTLYMQINPNIQQACVLYELSLTGSYISSSYISLPETTVCETVNVRSYSDINYISVINLTNTQYYLGKIISYNKDGSFGGEVVPYVKVTNNVITEYYYNTLFTDENGLEYSTVYLYGFTGPVNLLSSSFTDYSVFILGNPIDTTLNQNFTIRRSTYDFDSNSLEIILDRKLKTSELIRSFQLINGISGSNQYYASNISISNLYDVGVFSITGPVNTIQFTTLFNHLPGTIDLSKSYNLTFTQQSTGSTGYYTSIVPISLTYDTVTQKYSATLENINDLQVPFSSGNYYGPTVCINQTNETKYYSLQWYPGSRIFSQSYLVGLYDLIIPNRPIRNSRYPGLRTINDYPYVYLVIYNSNEENQFDSTVVNSVFDNNIQVPRFALFQLPTTSFAPLSSNSNYISVSSTSTPRILFSPNYYNLTFKLTDDRGNVLLFDNTPYKESDAIFSGKSIPSELLNITARLVFKKI